MTDLDELEKLCAAATPGPWSYKSREDSRYLKTWVEGPSTNPVIPSPDVVATPAYSDRFMENDAANMAFIATARTAVPELIKRVRELEGWQRLRAKDIMTLGQQVSTLESRATADAARLRQLEQARILREEAEALEREAEKS